MKRNNDNRKNSKNVLDSFVLIDEPIDLSIQEEYIRFSETIDFDNLDYEEVLKESDKLFDQHTPIELKKRILIFLAHLGSPESCRTIENYLKVSDMNLKDWALLSLQECRTFLESVLLQEEGGFKEEKEWRLVFLAGANALFREGDTLIIPYVDFDLKDENGNLPIDNIWIGPTINMDESLSSLKLLLEKYKIPASIEKSTIPYRPGL
jgi:hypothetical protein